MQNRRITKSNIFQILSEMGGGGKEDYLAMYSSQWKGITTDPDLMLIPIDDHVVHRGDGVFDVMRCINGKVYQMESHLGRLEKSAKAIRLVPPPEYKDLKHLIKETVLAGGEKNCVIRVMISRGPGSFTANPFDCPTSHLYINVIRFQPLPEENYQNGVCIITSRIPAKDSFFANIKSCNYLPNVMMKMEAIQRGCPYAVSLDEEGFIAEGPTENIVVVTQDGVMRIPGFDRTLAGITAKRIFELAHVLVKQGHIKKVKFDKIAREQAYGAKEIFLTGTSVNVLPVVQYDGNLIGSGLPGPVCQRLAALLLEDMTQHEQMLTDIF